MSDEGATPRPTGSMIALALLADRMGGFMLLLLRLEIWLGRSDGFRRRLLLGRPGKNMRPADCETTALRLCEPTRRRGRVNQEEGRRRLRHDMRGSLRRLRPRSLLQCKIALVMTGRRRLSRIGARAPWCTASLHAPLRKDLVDRPVSAQLGQRRIDLVKQLGIALAHGDADAAGQFRFVRWHEPGPQTGVVRELVSDDASVAHAGLDV